jgi:DNA-binding response OmpR family regulator
MAKILLIEDDVALVRMLKNWLTLEHYKLDTAENGARGLEFLAVYKYDAIILDLEMPEVEGMEVLERFRTAGGKTPVLILTGKDSIHSKLAGLDAGADDYLTKPFHVKELSARLRALLRRSADLPSHLLKVRDIVLDPKDHTVKRGEEELQLLPTEFALLEFFMRNPNEVFSAEALLDRVWTSKATGTLSALTTCIKRMRQKIDIEGEPSIIKTVHGVGYKLVAN